MARISFIILFILTTMCNSADAASPARKLIKRLGAIEKKGVIAFGHHDDTAYGHSWMGETDRSDVKSVCGDYPAIMDWDLGGIENINKNNLDGVKFNFIRSEVRKHNARGGISCFSWHLLNPTTGKDSWDVSNKEVVKNCLTPGSTENVMFTKWLANAADYISSLTDEQGKKIAIVFRPWHEHTGSWFWWGEDLCSVDDYKAMWHLTRKVFDDKKVNNVVWAYSPDKIKSIEDYMTRYPGDKYIDIMGADTYHFNGVEGRADYLKRLNLQLSAATKYARERGKIAALTETGLESITIDDWFTQTLLPAIEKYPIAYIVVWRNAHDNPKHFYAPYPGHTSVNDFLKFYNDKKTIFNKELKSIK